MGSVLGAAALMPAQAGGPSDPEAARARMVESQIVSRGVTNPRVLDAMRAVPRHRFVPEAVRGKAYEDRPLEIGEGQTISQPYMVAVMTELLDPQSTDRVLEIGTGSGYQAAVLARLVEHVYSVEIQPALAARARGMLAEGGVANVTVVTGDGYRGLPDDAPFDGIIVTAAPPKIPQALIDQLAPGARMVVPVGRAMQTLRLLERTADGVKEETLFGVRFVPMVKEARD